MWRLAGRPKNKYGNKKVGIYDSKKEAARAQELEFLKRTGEIEQLEHHVRFQISLNGIKVCVYEADFVYINKRTGKLVIEDVKSEPTRKARLYRLKKKLFEAQYSPLTISEV